MEYLFISNQPLAEADLMVFQRAREGWTLHTLQEHTHNPGRYYLVFERKKVNHNGILRRLPLLRSHAK